MSHFAKRHYEAIADAMQRAHPESRTFSDYTLTTEMARDLTPFRNQHEATVRALGDLFKSDNGQFQRDRFERACEPGANVRKRT